MDLTHAERREVAAVLTRSHEIRVRAALLDLDGAVIGSVTPKLIDGQVLFDRNGFGDPHGPQRRATLTLVDPHNALKVDNGDPDDGTLYYDRLVQVTYGIRVPALSRWVDIDVFTGPPWKLQRSNDEVYIDADDASVLGWGETWRPFHLPKGTKKIEAIRRLLSNRAGFTRFRLPKADGRLAHPVSLGRHTHPWAWADRIAASMDLQLYVDGSGAVCARRLPRTPRWTFRPGEGGAIVDPVALDTDRSRFANVVEVIGRKPKGEKRRVRYVATAPRKHPHSPWALERDGVPYRKVVTIENDHLRSTAECRRKAERILADRLRAYNEMTCSILPWPLATPGDMARFVTVDGEPTTDRMDTFPLPLGVSGSPVMPVGWFDRSAPHKRRIRR